jgi:hypothetical protein
MRVPKPSAGIGPAPLLSGMLVSRISGGSIISAIIYLFSFGFRRRLLDQFRHFFRVRDHGQMISRYGD